MEEDLIWQARRGDTLAFRMLVEQYSPIAWQVVRVLVPDSGQAEDAMQEAWIDVWRGLPQFDLTRPFRPWLLTVVANRCRMLARRPRLRLLALSDEIAGTVPSTAQMPEESSAPSQRGALQAALAALTPEQRRVVALRYQAELDLAEIAIVCQLPLSTVKSRLYRALAALRLRLLTPSSTPTPEETLP
jgi:RNA polymerase sigma-70 factor (ECF subfamily)